MSGSYPIGRAADIPPGDRRIVTLEGRSIGVFNVSGTYYALRNRCPHLAGPLCQGRVGGLLTATDPEHVVFERDGEILRCPWHGWEFDITTGRSVFEPEGLRVRAYEVTIEPEPEPVELETFPVTLERGQVVVHLRRPAGSKTPPTRRDER
jgi:nitrite reductase/ring-hydroxylating ferredoxin subunit